MIDQYTIIPSFSLEPNKLATFNRILRKQKPLKSPGKKQISTTINENSSNQYDFFQSIEKTQLAISPKVSAIEIFKNPKVKRKFHNFLISENAHRTLKLKINWLYFLAKSKQVTTYNGKNIFNFKMAFITLTLPSVQKHSTVFITKNLFNQFLTEVRQRTKMKNYVWRLEFQKNGNVHYHLATDTYLDYWFITKIWNRILSNYDYIQPYTAKHEKMNLRQYNARYNSNGKTEFALIAKRYATGKKNHWKQPNTCDVKSVISNASISNYISKYFSKSQNDGKNKNALDNEQNSANLRLWFCSRSLSKLNKITDFLEAINYDIVSIVSKAKKAKTYIFRWAKVVYFEIKNLSKQYRTFLEILLRNYAYNLEYLPSG